MEIKFHDSLNERTFIDASDNSIVGNCRNIDGKFYVTLYWKGVAFPVEIEVEKLDIEVDAFIEIYEMHV